jgi:hypothetical protein
MSQPRNKGLIRMQQWNQIQVLDEGGMSDAAIARKLGLDRETVAKWQGQPPPTSITRTRSSKLDPFHGYLTERLTDFPDLSARVLFREIVAQGYEGGYERVKLACRELHGEPQARSPSRGWRRRSLSSACRSSAGRLPEAFAMRLSQPQRRSIVLVVGRPRAAFAHSGRLGNRPCLAYHSRTASIACSWSARSTAVASLTIGRGQGSDRGPGCGTNGGQQLRESMLELPRLKLLAIRSLFA